MDKRKSDWTFFSNHGHVYFILASEENLVLREVATRVGITERAVQNIVQDLVEAGYLKRTKSGRSNKYKAASGKTLRHPLEKNVFLSDLASLIERGKEG